MATNVLLYDVIREGNFKYKSHYRLYNEERDLVKEGDWHYEMRVPRQISPGDLKSKITTSIWNHCVRAGLILAQDELKTSCLVTNEVIKKEVEEDHVPVQPQKVVEAFEKKVEVQNNPRIYRVVLINGNPTIVKAETPYLSREQAKEELFNKQLEEA